MGDYSYILCNKDTALVAFSCEHDRYGGEHFRVSQVADAGAAFPLGFDFRNDDGIEKWLRNRRAPKHRAHAEELLAQCGCRTMEGYINRFFCTGLNDTFWAKPSESAAKWADVSLFRNDFNDAIARLAFDGQGTPGADLSSTSPELSTDGSFAKCWKRDGDGIFLYKRGSSGAANAGLEPFSEALAHQIAQKLCDQAVPYELVNYHDALAAHCPLFTSEAVGYAPIVSCVGSAASLDDMLKFFDELGSGERFRQMMVLDALTLNPDRHLRNFGVSFDTDTGRVIGMAPVFDNNLSLCPYASESDLADAAACVGSRSNCFGQDFNRVAIGCLTDDIKERLTKMRDFSFSGLDDMAHRFGFSRERGALLEKLVNFQIDNVLNRRSVQIPTMAQPDDVRLDSLLLAARADGQIPFEAAELRASGEIELGMADGRALRARNCRALANLVNGELEIDVYQAEMVGESGDLRVVSVRGLDFLAPGLAKGATLQPLRLTVQLSRGSRGAGVISEIDPKGTTACVLPAPGKDAMDKATAKLFPKEDAKKDAPGSGKDETQGQGMSW